MRPGLACSTLLSAALIPAAAVLAQHHAFHGVVSSPMVHPGIVARPGMVGGSAGSQAGPTVNQSTVNTTYDYAPSYYYGSNYGGLGYGGLGYGGLGYYRYGAPYLYGAYGMPAYGFYGMPYGAMFAYAPGAVVLPTGALFGPQPIQQMLAGAAMPAVDPGPLGAQAPRAQAPRVLKVRVSNAEAKARAGKLIDQGDKVFANQHYHDALEHYKSAVIQAPDMAEIFLREGFTLIAIGQYESASKAIRRGLNLQRLWKPDELRLDRLYGPDKLAKTAHLEGLAVALQKSPHDATLLFLIGMELYFDGEVARSGPFFTRAAQLGANDQHLFDDFLSAATAAEKAAGRAVPAAPAAAAAPGAANAPPAAAPPADRGPILDL